MQKLKFMITLGVLLAASTSTLSHADDHTPNCYAYTYCPNLGYTINCQTWGAACSWYTQPGQYVTCTGYDYFGRWGTFWASCF